MMGKKAKRSRNVRNGAAKETRALILEKAYQNEIRCWESLEMTLRQKELTREQRSRRVGAAIAEYDDRQSDFFCDVIASVASASELMDCVLEIRRGRDRLKSFAERNCALQLSSQTTLEEVCSIVWEKYASERKKYTCVVSGSGLGQLDAPAERVADRNGVLSESLLITNDATFKNVQWLHRRMRGRRTT